MCAGKRERRVDEKQQVQSTTIEAIDEPTMPEVLKRMFEDFEAQEVYGEVVLKLECGQVVSMRDNLVWRSAELREAYKRARAHVFPVDDRRIKRIVLRKQQLSTDRK